MQGIVAIIKPPKVHAKLRRAGVVRDTSIDIWLSAYILLGRYLQASDIPAVLNEKNGMGIALCDIKIIKIRREVFKIYIKCEVYANRL